MKVFRSFFMAAVAIMLASGVQASDAPTFPAGLSDDAPCRKEQWPPARTLVWTEPGAGGTALEAGNWTEFGSADDYAAGKDGKPAEVGPDENTDLILPDAPDDGSYVVGCMVSAKQRRRNGSLDAPVLSCRHLTIGSGAALDGGIGVARGRTVTSDWPDDDTPIAICGNVTVKDGGYLYGPLHFGGGQHTWFAVGQSPEPLGRSFLVRKAAGASVTFAAKRYDLVDAVKVESGRLVLAPAATLRFGTGLQARIELKKLRKTGFGRVEPYLWVHEGAALELQGGSRIGRVQPPQDIIPDLRIEGLLQIGQTTNDNTPAVIELTATEGEALFLDQPGGLYFRPTGELQNFGSLSITAGNPNAEETDKDAKEVDNDNEPAGKGISIFLEKPIDFGKVRIDYLQAGGIAATDPAKAKPGLSGATFGEHCTATGDAIYSQIKSIDFKGGPGTVEFVDGLSIECEILYPLGNRLIVRSKGNRIVQSFDLRTVHAITIEGKRTEYNAKRDLTAEEQHLRETNALWADVPGEGQIGRYGKQTWPEAPVMVWRRPGTSGSRFVGGNWLDENGRPYFEPPIHEDTNEPNLPAVDILLPASDVFYQIVDDRPQWRIRHMTIENNVFFFLTYNIGGNLWMKDGGGIQAPWFGMYSNNTPDVHRFLRFDGMRIRRPGRGEQGPQRWDAEDCTISQWGRYQTGPDGTLEIIGSHMVNDHFFVGGEGKMIMSEDSRLAPLGSRAAFLIQPEATVVLLQDARIGVESTAMDRACIPVIVSGTLEIGTPDRPITRDMLFPVAGMEEDDINRNPGESMRGSGVSLLIGQQGRLVMHTVDPTKARVVFKMHDSEKAKTRGKRWSNPKGIVLDFAGKADLNGVVFDNVLPDGIMATPDERASWKNVFYGENNLAEPEALYWDGEANSTE